MSHRRTSLLLISLAAGSLAVAGSAAADPNAKPTTPATADAVVTLHADALAAGAPAGYVQRFSGQINAPAGVQTRGTITCPGAKVPVGGGAVIAGSDLKVNINSSFPLGRGWAVDVNNAGAPTTFSVNVVCLRKPKGYQVVRGASLPLPALARNFGFGNCSSNKVVLGGGALVNSGNAAVNLNSSFPVGDGENWRVDVNNPTSSDLTFDPFSICARAPKGYDVVFGSNADNRPLTQTSAFVACPGNAVPLSGGVISTGGINVSVNSLRLEPHSFTAFENNATDAAASMQPKVVCAGS